MPPDTWVLVLVFQYPVHVPRGAPATPHLPLVQICVTPGDRYALVHTAQMDLGEHHATLTPPGGTPLVITTPMVAKATYDKALGGGVGLLLVPSVTPTEHLSQGRGPCRPLAGEPRDYPITHSLRPRSQDLEPHGADRLEGPDKANSGRAPAFPPHRAGPTCRLGRGQHLCARRWPPRRAYSCRAEPRTGGPRPLTVPELRACRRMCMPSGNLGSMSVAGTCGNAC